MKRLTTDKNASEMSMIELAHNSCYADKERRARYRDYELDIDARDLAKMLINDMCNEDLSSMTDEEFDNYIKEMLADGMNSQIGLIALFYRNVWAMADLREKLADYEDTGMTPGQVIEMQMDWVAMKAASETYRKEKAERPDVYGDGYDPDGNLIYDMWDCPRCGASYEIDYDHYDYCPNCGQKIDWSDEDEK